jgi:hypothetical protein
LRQRFTRIPRGGGWWRSRGAEFVSSPKNLLASVGATVSLTSGLFSMITRAL